MSRHSRIWRRWISTELEKNRTQILQNLNLKGKDLHQLTSVTDPDKFSPDPDPDPAWIWVNIGKLKIFFLSFLFLYQDDTSFLLENHIICVWKEYCHITPFKQKSLLVDVLLFNNPEQFFFFRIRNTANCSIYTFSCTLSFLYFLIESTVQYISLLNVWSMKVIITWEFLFNSFIFVTIFFVFFSNSRFFLLFSRNEK